MTYFHFLNQKPDEVYKETVPFVVALNGKDYTSEGDKLKFTFTGTASYLVFWPWIIGAILLALLIIALILFCGSLYEWAMQFMRRPAPQPIMEPLGGAGPKSTASGARGPYVIRDPFNQVRPICKLTLLTF